MYVMSSNVRRIRHDSDKQEKSGNLSRIISTQTIFCMKKSHNHCFSVISRKSHNSILKNNFNYSYDIKKII